MNLQRGTFTMVIVALGVALSTTACGAIQEMASQADCVQEYSQHAGDIDQDSTATEIAEAQEELLEDEDFLNCGFGEEAIETETSAESSADGEDATGVAADDTVAAGQSDEVDSSADNTADGGPSEVGSYEWYNATCGLLEQPIPGSFENPHPIGEPVTACMNGEVWTYTIDYVRIGEPTGPPTPLVSSNYGCAVVVGTATLEWYNQATSSVPSFPWSKLAAGDEWGSDAAWSCEAVPEVVEGLSGDKGVREVEIGKAERWYSLFRIELGAELNYVEIEGNHFVE